MSAKAKIIRNKEEKALEKFQNQRFKKDPKRFIESFDEEKIEVKTQPSEEQLSDFLEGFIKTRAITMKNRPGYQQERKPWWTVLG